MRDAINVLLKKMTQLILNRRKMLLVINLLIQTGTPMGR